MLGVEGSECDVHRIMLNSSWSRRKVYRTVIAVNGESGKLSGVKSGLYMPWLSHNGQSHGEQWKSCARQLKHKDHFYSEI